LHPLCVSYQVGLEYNQGDFCDGMCRNTVLELFSEERKLEPFFPGIGIAPPLSNQILGHSLHFRTSFLRKLALNITITQNQTVK